MKKQSKMEMIVMSADNVRLCPRCYHRAVDKVENGYGELSQEEYDKLKQKIDSPYENYSTLREYKVNSTTEEHGKIIIEMEYYVRCEECGLEGSMSEEKKIGEV